MNNEFAVFILSHGRANNVITYDTLRSYGYTGKIYIIIDNLDDQKDKYIEKFGDDVIIFDKYKAFESSDVMDTDTDMRIVLFARNECHNIAKDLGLTYFLELDDDYTAFRHRVEVNGKLRDLKMPNLDKLFEAIIEFLETSGAVTVALAQGGDFIGGANSSVAKKGLSRKAMNSFFCKTDRPFKFLGRINEDVNAYTLLGSQGMLFFTIASVLLEQLPTQQNQHGLTDVYLKYGTYVKSFYSVICMPSAVKIDLMGVKDKRIHHCIDWDRCVPMIVSDKYMKK